MFYHDYETGENVDLGLTLDEFIALVQEAMDKESTKIEFTFH